jgi:hypothetical protein
MCGCQTDCQCSAGCCQVKNHRSNAVPAQDPDIGQAGTGTGVLDIFDFLCFGNRFDVGDPYACDCDVTTGPGLCDIFDFICFGDAFNAGCP